MACNNCSSKRKTEITRKGFKKIGKLCIKIAEQEKLPAYVLGKKWEIQATTIHKGFIIFLFAPRSEQPEIILVKEDIFWGRLVIEYDEKIFPGLTFLETITLLEKSLAQRP